MVTAKLREQIERAKQYAREARMAGFGPISDGIPEPLGDSERALPSAPRTSRPLIDFDKTAPMRKARP